MLDVGWTELVVIAIVLIIVVGPKDLPPMLRTFGKMMTKFRGMASDFRQQFDEALKEADLDDVRKTLADAQKLNPAHSLREAMNPLRQMGNDIKADLHRATTVDARPKDDAVAAPLMTETSSISTPPEEEQPQQQAAVDPVMAAAKASAAKQLERAAAVEKPKAKRTAKPQALVADTPVSANPKTAAKKTVVVDSAAEIAKPVRARRTAAKINTTKGDA